MGFRVGSNTRPYVATLVMMLWDEELVELDASLADYLPEYPQWSEVTIRMLMNMRSWHHDYLTEGSATERMYFSRLMRPCQHIIRGARKRPDHRPQPVDASQHADRDRPG